MLRPHLLITLAALGIMLGGCGDARLPAGTEATVKQQLTPTLASTSNTAVTWSIQEGTAGGTVSTGGLYTAPGTAGTYHIVATCEADPTKSDVAVITVCALPPSGYVGCYTDSATRALPTRLTPSSATLESCIAAANSAGLAYAGAQNGSECWGGNAVGVSLVSDSQCNVPCGGNACEMCGGPGLNSIYATGAGSGGAVYTTNFDLTESPLSENGAWHHDGLDWTKVDSGSGIAFGTQTPGVNRGSGASQYNDSYAYLSGFPADQQASGIVHLGSIDASCTHEVEILMRWSDSAHIARGYECNLAFDGSYAQIVRWNGAVGDFTFLASGSVPGGVHGGDTISASAVGNLITLSVNGVVRASAHDSTFPTGNPGIAFWRGASGCGTRGDYGFTSFTARSAP